jgi:SpoVK/Ycf46/Vps4 family AAA+-type ATPase
MPLAAGVTVFLHMTVCGSCCAIDSGFTGADIQNLMNEAAILAARRELKEVSKEEIADALERIVAGPEKKGAVVSEPKKRLVAYHEVCAWHNGILLLLSLTQHSCLAAVLDGGAASAVSRPAATLDNDKHLHQLCGPTSFGCGFRRAMHWLAR